MATQAERREETQHRIVSAARSLFVEQGIDATTTAQILDAAGVSRGAMYHHFPSRDDLVATVYEQEAAGSIDRAMTRIDPTGTPYERLLNGCRAWLDEVGRPDVARIVIEDGPGALGWARCRDIEGRYSIGLVTAGLSAAVDSGEIEVPDITLTALLVNALLAEAALAVTHARNKKAARRDVDATIVAMLAGLRPRESDHARPAPSRSKRPRPAGRR